MRTGISLATMVFLAFVWSGACFAQPDRAPAPSPEEAAGAEAAQKADRNHQDEVLDQLDHKLHELESKREELGARIEKMEQGQAPDKGSAQELKKLRTTAEARLVALYKFKQMGYAIPLLAARDPNAAAEAGYLMTKLLLNDQQLLLSFQKRSDKAGIRDAVASRPDEELKGLRLELGSLDQELLSARKTRMEMLDQAGRQESAPNAASDSKIDKQALNPKTEPELQAKPFSSRQGTLKLPVRGEITAAFGPKTHVPSGEILYNGGIIITAPKGEKVRAVHDGVVMFADWFKEYGKVMIIDHGEHYYSLIAHADQFLKKVGERVKEGEVIATVGDTGSMDVAKLYFEIRHHGKPVDPMEWLAVRKLSKE